MDARFFFLFLLAYAPIKLYAQKTSLSFYAGITNSHIKNCDGYWGYTCGVDIDRPLSDKESSIYVGAGLQLANQGWKDKLYDISLQNKYTWTCNLYYLKLPLHLGYQYAPNKDLSLSTSLGPYFAYGLTGKSEIKKYEDSLPNEGNPFTNNVYKHFDIGWHMQIGTTFKQHYKVAISYTFGMRNPTQKGWKALSRKDRTINFTLGYVIN